MRSSRDHMSSHSHPLSHFENQRSLRYYEKSKMLVSCYEKRLRGFCSIAAGWGSSTKESKTEIRTVILGNLSWDSCLNLEEV